MHRATTRSIPTTFGDRVWLGFEDPRRRAAAGVPGRRGPGAVTARRIVTGEYGRQSVRLEPRIRGAWQSTADGYRIEVRVPLSMIGKGLRRARRRSRHARGACRVSYGTLRTR